MCSARHLPINRRPALVAQIEMCLALKDYSNEVSNYKLLGGVKLILGKMKMYVLLCLCKYTYYCITATAAASKCFKPYKGNLQ
jgi:hypothetical protein